ncbi:MAG: MFS transporter [Sphingobium sp.]
MLQEASPAHPKAWKVMLALIMAEISAASALAMPLPALASWLEMYGSPIAVGWIMSSFLLVSAAVAALCGSLGDRYGRKRVILIILTFLIIGSVMSAWTDQLGWVIAGRCLQGAVGAVLPLILGLSREALPPAKVSMGFGIIIASASGASAIGFPVAGYLTDHFGPSSIFWVLVLLGVLAFGAIGLILPASRPPARAVQGVDWLGGLLFAPAVALILLGISGGRQGGWMATMMWPMLLVGAVMLVFWYWHERRHPAPLIDVRLFTDRRCQIALVVAALVAVGAFQMTEAVALLLQQPVWTGAGLALTATMAGLFKLPGTIGGTLSSIVTGLVAGRRGPLPGLIGGAALIVATSVLAIFFHDEVAAVVIAYVMVSIGVTAVYTSVPILIALGTPADRTSEAMGVMAVVRALFQGTGAQIVAVLLASWTVTGPTGIQFPADTAYSVVFAYVGLTALLIVLIALPLLGRSLRPAVGGVAHAAH